MPVWVGIDPSYTNLALMAFEGESTESSYTTHRLSLSTRKSCEPERLVYLREGVLRFVKEWSPQLVCIEGYSYNSKQNREMAGELVGQLKTALWENGFAYAVVGTTTHKKFCAGAGNAPKSLLMLKVYQRWGYEPVDDDDADAYIEARIARELCRPKELQTKAFRALVKNVEIVPCRPPQKPKKRRRGP